MLKFLIVTMFLAQGAFANHVELKIDGEQYYCSKDPNGTGGVDANCEKAAAKFTKKFEACKSAGNYASDCFKQINSEVSGAEKKCSEVAEVCNSSCKSAGNYASDCYKVCY